MRAREHRPVRLAACERGELGGALLEHEDEAAARLTEEPRVAQIVDVLRGAAEVHELEGGFTRSRGRKLLAHVVLDRLDIMIDARLDGLDRRRAVRIRLAGDLTRPRARGRSQSGTVELRHRRAQMQQPRGLDPRALADESRLGEQLPQWLRGRAVAAIDRRERRKGGKRIGAGRIGTTVGHALS
jgi:hypothetical protein